MAELIKKTDTLNQGREKLNTAITDAETAKNISAQADDKATQALAQSESTQTQLDTIVIEGDSSVEAAQARVSTTGTAYGTLKQRLDSEYQEVTTQLAQTAQDLSDRGINIKHPPFNAKGNGADDDLPIILDVLSQYDTIYFPKGDYGLGSEFLLSGIENKTMIFHPEARLLQLSGVPGRTLSLVNCNNLKFHNLSTHSLSNDNGTNAVGVNGSKNLEFTGITRIGYSRSIAFILRDNTSDVFIDTVIVDDPLTRDGLSLMYCHDITINNVIGKNNSDDLVVVKAVGGSTYNINIGQITAYNTIGTFSIGSEVWDGDIHNITVNSIVARGCKNGAYFKMWDNHSNTQRGEVYNIVIHSLTFFNDQTDDAKTPDTGIYFHVDDVPEFYNKYHDIHFGTVNLEGAFLYDAVWIQRSKRITIDNLTVKTLIPESDTRNNLNRNGYYLTDSTDCFVRGGKIEATNLPVNIYNNSHRNKVYNVECVKVDRNGIPLENADRLMLIHLSNDCEVIGCNFSQPHDISIDFFNADTRRPSRTTRREGNIGRDHRMQNLPTTGKYFAGDYIPCSHPDSSGIRGWTCTVEGTPGTWVASGINNRTATSTPTLTPRHIGEEVLDTTNKRWYKAVGLTSSDWVALN